MSEDGKLPVVCQLAQHDLAELSKKVDALGGHFEDLVTRSRFNWTVSIMSVVGAGMFALTLNQLAMHSATDAHYSAEARISSILARDEARVLQMERMDDRLHRMCDQLDRLLESVAAIRADHQGHLESR